MKAITILQPWATLIALGEKHFETRSWPTKARGEIAIHAGKKIDKEVFEEFHSTLWGYGIFLLSDLPTGSVVATASLAECWKWDESEGVLLRNNPIVEYEAIGKTKNRIVISDKEKSFGWYGEGRYAWEMTDVRKLPEPIPAKGQQGLWNWEGNLC